MLDTFSVTLTRDDLQNREKMDAFSEMMAKVQDETVAYIKQLAVELNASEECAMDVFYLRTRSRWTQELENELIQLHKSGVRPNMCEFGCKL